MTAASDAFERILTAERGGPIGLAQYHADLDLVREVLDSALSADMAETILEAGLYESRLFRDEDEITAAADALRAIAGHVQP